MIMRYTVTTNVVQVIGTIWMPAVTCAMEYKPRDGELQDTATRDDVAAWLTTHSGDFQSIEDFNYSIGAGEWSGWKSEESECTFSDCMYPCGD